MLEVVAFEFEGEVIVYRDGEYVDKVDYQYDESADRYVFAFYAPLIEALAPGAPRYYVPNKKFYEAARLVDEWDYVFVLELARKLNNRW